MHKNMINEMKQKLLNAEALLITAGAGMGVDSGLPDFRGNEGFWKAYPPMAKLGIEFHQMANPYWFRKDPSFAWGFYGHRLNLYRDTIPHEGFKILLDIAEEKPEGYFVFTSNVDGQFQKAGFYENYIEECHGSIHYNQCQTNCKNDIWSSISENVKVNKQTFKADEPLPVCPHCKEVARPNILMFEDWDFNGKRSTNQETRFNKWIQKLKDNKSKLCIVEIGAGKAIPTVRMLSEEIAKELNATLIRINPRDYQVPAGQYYIAKGGLSGIKELLA